MPFNSYKKEETIYICQQAKVNVGFIGWQTQELVGVRKGNTMLGLSSFMLEQQDVRKRDITLFIPKTTAIIIGNTSPVPHGRSFFHLLF